MERKGSSAVVLTLLVLSHHAIVARGLPTPSGQTGQMDTQFEAQTLSEPVATPAAAHLDGVGPGPLPQDDSSSSSPEDISESAAPTAERTASPPVPTPLTEELESLVSPKSGTIFTPIAPVYGVRLRTVDDSGLTESQRQQIMRSLAYAAYGAENFVAAFRRLAEVNKIAKLAQTLSLFGPFLGWLGTGLAVLTLFIHTSDPTMEFLHDQFAQMDAQITSIETEMKQLTSVIQAEKSIQTYIQQYDQYVLKVASAAEEYAKNVKDASLEENLLNTCNIYPPDEFIAYALGQLTADGSCPTNIQCLLDTQSGLPQIIKFSQPDFLTYAKAFVAQIAHAAQMASACAGVKQASNETMQDLTSSFADQLNTLANNLVEYHDNTLATAFWEQQFQQDLSEQLSQGSDNAGRAHSLQSLLTTKYENMDWSVAVWDAGTGSDKQGINSLDITATPSPSSSATGLAYHALRYSLSNGESISFMIFASPVGKGIPNNVNSNISSAVNLCSSSEDDGKSDMVFLVNCLRQKLPTSRALLCVKFGMGLRVTYSNIFFENVATKFKGLPEYEGYGVPDLLKKGPEVSFLVMS